MSIFWLNYLSKYISVIGLLPSPLLAFNFLGLTLDEHLNWNAHIQKVANKISRALGVMNRLKIFLPHNILKIIYNSLILPHLNYAMLVWGFNLVRLEKLQKRAVRIIKNSNYNSHTEPIFKDLHLLKLEDIFICNILKLHYKLEHQTVPQYFINTFTSRFPTHSYDTRNKDQPLFFRPHTQHAEKKAFGLLCLELLKIQTVALLTKYTLIPFMDSVIIWKTTCARFTHRSVLR